MHRRRSNLTETKGVRTVGSLHPGRAGAAAETTPKFYANAGSLGTMGASIQDHNPAVGNSSRDSGAASAFASVSESKFQWGLVSQTARKVDHLLTAGR